ncbi:hypothetical protein K0F50_05045 [Bacteroides fragilis]|nr:hypothetical protein [Bacteroides fragilis]
MKSQEHIDDLIQIILTAEEKESVSNQMVGEVLEFLNERQFEDTSPENPQGEAGLKKQVRELSLKVKELERQLNEFIGLTYIEAVIIPASGGEVLVGVRTKNKEWTVE